MIASNMHEPCRLTDTDQIALKGCPSCGSSELVPFRRTEFRGADVYHQRCGACGHVFLNPCPNQEWYNRLFAEEYWEGRAKKWGVDVRKNQLQWRKQLHRAEHYLAFLSKAGLSLPLGARILEIGCAYGMIVRTLAEHFHGTALGVEPSRVARAFAREVIGVEIVADAFADIDKWESAEPVDMILFSHVMEYIVDLEHVFSVIRRVVRPGGLVLMETPNIFFRHAAHVYHPHCFSKRSLRELFARHGMKIVALAPSGRLRTVLSPNNYLTVAASIPLSTRSAEPTPRGKASKYTGIMMELGQAWYRVVNRYPLYPMLMALNGETVKLSPQSEKQLAEVIARASAIGPSTGEARSDE